MNDVRKILADRRRPFFIAGPCSIESQKTLSKQASELLGIFGALDLHDRLIFKASADKANRTSGSSYRGPGFEMGLEYLRQTRSLIGLPTITDVHETHHCTHIVDQGIEIDMLQIPANLCRQTDLIEAAGMTGLPILFKKGRFMKPTEVRPMVEKVAGRPGPFAVCERGVCFGYNTVVDMTGLQVMRDLLPEVPLVFDCTHSAPSRDFAPALARAAVATGYVDGIFMEVHPNPNRAPCDGEKMIYTGDLPGILTEILKIWKAIRK